MMGSGRRAQVAQQITGAVQKAGGMLTVVAVLAGAALITAVVALVVALAGRRARLA